MPGSVRKNALVNEVLKELGVEVGEDKLKAAVDAAREKIEKQYGDNVKIRLLPIINDEPTVT